MNSNAMGVLAGVIALLALAFGGLHGLLIVITFIVCWWLVRPICIAAQAHHAKRTKEREAARQRKQAEKAVTQRQQYAQIAEPAAELIANLEASNTNLGSQRDLLLPRLISGELSVPTAPHSVQRIRKA